MLTTLFRGKCQAKAGGGPKEVPSLTDITRGGRSHKVRINKMIVGAHVIIYSRKPEADRAFFRDIFEFSNVDVGEGWLIFALPPAELAIHPSSKKGQHELYFICRDIDQFVAAMEKKDVSCSPVRSLGWGKLTQIRLPGGGQLGVYQPLHARPKATKQRAKRK